MRRQSSAAATRRHGDALPMRTQRRLKAASPTPAGVRRATGSASQRADRLRGAQLSAVGECPPMDLWSTDRHALGGPRGYDYLSALCDGNSARRVRHARSPGCSATLGTTAEAGCCHVRCRCVPRRRHSQLAPASGHGTRLAVSSRRPTFITVELLTPTDSTTTSSSGVLYT